MDIKNYVKRNVLNFKSQVLDEAYVTKEELANAGDGKSAYQTAVEGGYTGTEAEFTAALGSLETMTREEIMDRLNGGDDNNA